MYVGTGDSQQLQGRPPSSFVRSLEEMNSRADSGSVAKAIRGKEVWGDAELGR